MADEENAEECKDVWRNGEKLCFYACVAERFDDGWEEEGVRVYWRDDSEKVQRQEDGVPVQDGKANPVPGKRFRVDCSRC